MFNSNLKSQTINIDSTFYADAEIYPFSPNDTIYGLSISGSIELNSDTSLVRVILVDEDYNEYMVYEAYPMIITDSAFDIIEECDETCYLDEVIPSSLKIYIIEANIGLDSCTQSNNSSSDNLDSLRYESKRLKDFQKIQVMNQNIATNGWNWTAGDNDLLSAYYSEKKNLFGGDYNLQGFDFYIDGYFDYWYSDTTSSTESTVIDNFDWRSVHDANDPDSKYDFSSNGWLTSVKDQTLSCGSCWVFGPIGSMKAITNLYFNAKLDYDYSEKNVLCCEADNSNNCDGGFPETSLSYMQDSGTINDTSHPYSPYSIDCCDSADPSPYTHKILDYHTFTSNEITQHNIKSKIIQRGPLVAWINSTSLGLNHVMALVGFERNPFDNNHYWIFKDSYGSNPTFSGYRKMIVPSTDFEELQYLITPIHQTGTSHEIETLDLDRDGYYNWGIITYDSIYAYGWETPCDTAKDSNDNNGRIGPYNNNDFSGDTVAPEMNVYLGHPDFGGEKIANNEFIYFTESDLQNDKLNIYIENVGDAYINFESENPVDEIQDYDSCFVLHAAQVDTQLCWNPSNNLSDFQIEFKSECQISYDIPPVAVYKIDVHSVDEDVLEDFEFSLVYYDCGITDGTYEIPVNATEVWADHRVVTKNVKVKTGAKLEITGWVEFTKDCEIWVEAGAELLIDGGVLSGACDEFWNGIDVWGDAEESQFEDDQGRVKIKNGGTIMHANCGIETGKFVSGYYIPSGGIVHSNGAIFQDNQIGIRFHPYHNFIPPTGDPANNFSGIKKTSFITTQEIYNLNKEPESFIDLNWVEGILFKGNTYINEATTSNGEDRGIGIKSATAGFYVINECANPNTIPCSEYLISTFEQLDYGIRVFGERESVPIVIDSATFTDNLRSIFISGMNSFEIFRNTFEMDVPNSVHETNDTLCGIYLEACQDFLLTENHIKGFSGTQMKHAGIYASNLGPYHNEIYNNSIENLSCGVVAAGENRNGTIDGLCVYCNDFDQCQYDIYVIPYGGVDIDELGIHLYQGDFGINAPPGVDTNAMAAGNTFTSDDYVDMEYSYYNHPDLNWIQYIHHPEPPDIELSPSPYNRVDCQVDPEVNYLKDISCPSILSSGINVQMENSTLANEAIQIEAYQDTISQFVDGGDTDGLNFEVQTSFPDEALQVRQELLNESPYLSDTVMKSAISKENILPNAMVRDVLVANPQSAKSADVINTLNQRFEPMPDYMLAEIMNGLNIIGSKEILERKLAKHSSQRGKSFSKLVRYYKHDTINAWAVDSLITLLQNEQTPDRRYRLAFMHLGMGDSVSVINTINNIPIEFDLSNNEEMLHDLYEDLFDVMLEIDTDTIGLDSLQIAALQEISLYHSKLPAVYARNTLMANREIEYHEPLFLPDNLKSTPVWEYNKPKQNLKSPLNVFPNPASNYFIIEYDLYEYYSDAQIIISDINGKHVFSVSCMERQNQLLISTNDYPSGTYIIQLFINSELTGSKKINIVKM